jgi:hydrogenase maturation protease
VKISILGIGNLLMKDEGIGIHALRELGNRDLPDCVELVDGGVSGLDALNLIGKTGLLIVLDAVRGGEEPGAVFRFTPDDVTDIEGLTSLSLHDLTFLDALKLAKALGFAAEKVVIFGMEPAEIDVGMELSPAVQNRVADIVNLALKEIGEFMKTDKNSG